MRAVLAWMAIITAQFLTAPFLSAAERRASYLVELDSSARLHSNSLRADLAVPIRHEYSVVFSGAAVELSPAELARVRKLPYVRAVHVDHSIEKFEPATSRTNTLAEVIDARARVNASAMAARGAGIRVAVIDSGIDATHPAFAGRIAGGWDFAQDDPIPDDNDGHGTHVAGILAANAAELIGVAPDVTLYAYKVVHVNGDGKESSVLAALERCIDPNGDGDPSDHLDVANISLGWRAGASSIASQAVELATAAGVVVVVAAGNLTESPARVMAPGVAPSAITVANAASAHATAFDSAAGPTPGTLAFKPDVAAPGNDIISAAKGGGVTSKGGTSMASPHVAGIAALLLELHPDWTPADVKAALISTAHPMNDAPQLLRGAGFVDALAAHGAQFVTDVTGLMFGVNGAKNGTFDATRTFTLTNRGTAAATFTASAASTPQHMTATVTPPSFTLAAGASRTISVRVTADNAQLSFPESALLGGTIHLQSAAATVDVPWGLIRAARATITYDGAISSVFALTAKNGVEPYLYASGSAEMYVAPGADWDVVLLAHDGDTARVLIREATRVDHDHTIALTAEQATRPFALDARDPEGFALHSLPHGSHHVMLRMRMTGTLLTGDVLSLGSVSAIRLSPFSGRFRIAPLESHIDVASKRAFHLQHAELTGDGATLTVDASAYVHGRLRWKLDRAAPQQLLVTAIVGYGTGKLSTIHTNTVVGTIAHDETFDVYVNAQTPLDSFAGLLLDGTRVQVPLLRAAGNELVIAPDLTPSPVARRIANGSEAAIGNDPVHPFAFPGTAPSRGEFEYRGGWYGGSGEARPAATAATYPSQFTFSTDELRIGEHNSRADLTVVFGNQPSDLTAPTFTSLRIDGHTLRFSAADLDYAQNAQTRAMRPEATRAWYRAHGTSAWLPLPVVIEDAEAGNLLTLGHVPSGEIYRVDLSGLPPVLDLRLDIEDASGNRVTLTQSPARAVGARAPRRRAV